MVWLIISLMALMRRFLLRLAPLHMCLARIPGAKALSHLLQ